jgi:hypothetical protein
LAHSEIFFKLGSVGIDCPNKYRRAMTTEQSTISAKNFGSANLDALAEHLPFSINNLVNLFEKSALVLAL